MLETTQCLRKYSRGRPTDWCGGSSRGERGSLLPKHTYVGVRNQKDGATESRKQRQMWQHLGRGIRGSLSS